MQQFSPATLLSQTARSIVASGSCGLAGWFADDCYPLMHIIEEWSREKLSLQRSQLTVWLQDWLCLLAIIDASFLYTTLAVGHGACVLGTRHAHAHMHALYRACCMTFQVKYKRYQGLCTVEPESWVKLLVRTRERIESVYITIVFVSVLVGFIITHVAWVLAQEWVLSIQTAKTVTWALTRKWTLVWTLWQYNIIIITSYL